MPMLMKLRMSGYVALTFNLYKNKLRSILDASEFMNHDMASSVVLQCSRCVLLFSQGKLYEQKVTEEEPRAPCEYTGTIEFVRGTSTTCCESTMIRALGAKQDMVYCNLEKNCVC